MSKYVVEIPGSEDPGPIWERRLRVAAYCRVSTEHEEQQNSLTSQIEFYTDYIQQNPCKNSPAVKSNLAALEARYKELLDLVMADSAKYEDFEDEFRITNEKMASLKSLQIKLELEQPSAADLDRRMEQIGSAVEQMAASITEYDDIRTRQLISTIFLPDPRQSGAWRLRDTPWASRGTWP